MAELPTGLATVTTAPGRLNLKANGTHERQCIPAPRDTRTHVVIECHRTVFELIFEMNIRSPILQEVSNLRKEAAAALGEIADPPALVYLQRAASDPDPDVRKLVRWAIERCQAA